LGATPGAGVECAFVAAAITRTRLRHAVVSPAARSRRGAGAALCNPDSALAAVVDDEQRSGVFYARSLLEDSGGIRAGGRVERLSASSRMAALAADGNAHSRSVRIGFLAGVWRLPHSARLQSGFVASGVGGREADGNDLPLRRAQVGAVSAAQSLVRR